MLHRVAGGLLAATLTIGLAAAVLSGSAVSAEAATAHNSQAGSWGPTTHNCAPTPYFTAGGCASAAILDDRRYPFDIPPSAYRPGPRLTYPGDGADRSTAE